jgi:hypothetical protein
VANPGIDLWTARVRELAETVGTINARVRVVEGAIDGPDPFTQYLNITRGDARYALVGGAVPIASVTGLQAALDGKAASSHTQAISTITGLQAAIDGKQDAGDYATELHGHVIANVTGLQAALDGKQAAGSYAAASHTHVIADVDGLQDALDNAGGSASTAGTATIDFGAFPGSNEASVAFSLPTAASDTVVQAFVPSNGSTSDHSANDHRYAADLFTLSAQPSAGVGGTIHARSIHKMQGTFAVRWLAAA